MKKKSIWKRKKISLLLLLSFLNLKILFFIEKGGGAVFAERDVTQEGFCEQTWQSMKVGVGGSREALLVWRNYWITP